MKNKPPEMLVLSPKGTVPVLVLVGDSNKVVVDESLDIMLWTLNLNDPENLLKGNDEDYKPKLEQYKSAKRFHGDDEEQRRLLCEPFIQRLEYRLQQDEFLMGATPSLLDYALLPFIRQFSRVDRQRYLHGPYTHLQRWLNHHLQSRLFSKSMTKYPLWLDNHEECILGE